MLKLDKAKLIYSIKDVAMQSKSISKETLDVLIMEVEEEHRMLKTHYETMIPLLKNLRDDLALMIRVESHKPD